MINSNTKFKPATLGWKYFRFERMKLTHGTLVNTYVGFKIWKFKLFITWL